MNFKESLILKSTILVISVLFIFLVWPSIIKAQAIFQDVPPKIDVNSRYLFFFHGQIVENQGIRPTSRRYGVYEYQKILEAFKNKGFVVISEARQKNTDIWKYAQKVKGQIIKLLNAGLPPQNINIVGASKGGAIAILVSSAIRNKNINYVIIAGCGERFIQFLLNRGIYLWGNVLSIYDRKDEVGGSCRKLFEESKGKGLNKYKEIVLDMGLGHGFHYRPLKEWVEPIAAWAGLPESASYKPEHHNEKNITLDKQAPQIEVEIRKVVAGPFRSEKDAWKKYENKSLQGLEVLKTSPKNINKVYFILKVASIITEKDFKDVNRIQDRSGNPAIEFILNPEGASILEKFTSENLGKKLAIIIDGLIVSLPTIQAVISYRGIIAGRFTAEEVDEIVAKLKKSANL